MRISKHLATVGLLSLALATALAAAPTHSVLADAGDMLTITSTAPSNTFCGTPLHGDATVSVNVQDDLLVTAELDLTDAGGAVKQVLQTYSNDYTSKLLNTLTLFGFNVAGSVPEGSWLKFSIISDDKANQPGSVQTTSMRWQCFGNSVPTPYIPPTFVQRQISCSTALYWAADPKATVNTGDHISAGQVWYVNPTAVKGTDGKQWTAVYVGSFTLVYIPTSCAFQTQTVANAAPPPSSSAQVTNANITYSFPVGLHS